MSLENDSGFNFSCLSRSEFSHSEPSIGMFCFTIATVVIGAPLNVMIFRAVSKTKGCAQDIVLLMQGLAVCDIVLALSTTAFLPWLRFTCNPSEALIIAGAWLSSMSWSGSVFVSFHIAVRRLRGILSAVKFKTISSASSRRRWVVVAFYSLVGVAFSTGNASCFFYQNENDTRKGFTEKGNILCVCTAVFFAGASLYCVLLTTLAMYLGCLWIVLKHGSQCMQGKRIKLCVVIVLYLAATCTRIWLFSVAASHHFSLAVFFGYPELLRFDATPANINPLFACAMSEALQEAVRNIFLSRWPVLILVNDWWNWLSAKNIITVRAVITA